MELRSECTHCGQWAVPTGLAWRDEQQGRTYIEFGCPVGHRFDTWREDWEQAGIVPGPNSDAEIVKEKASRNDAIFLPIVIILAVVAVIAFRGAQTTAGRITGTTILGLLALAFFVGWLMTRLRPGRLEVTREAVTDAHKKGKRSTQLLHAFGELRLDSTRAGTQYVRPLLRLDGTEATIEVQTFDLQDVIRACESKGWQFLD